MKKSLILTLALAIFVGSGILSCRSQSANAPEKCTMTQGDKTCICDEHQGKPCLAAEGKGPCSICQEKQKKAIQEFETLNEQVVDYMQSGDYGKALKAINDMNNKFPAHPLVLYNMTCIYSLMDKQEVAISCLRDAVRCGWNDWKYMDNDPDINNIRDTRDYKKIRNELRNSPPENSDENPDEDFEEDTGE